MAVVRAAFLLGILLSVSPLALGSFGEGPGTRGSDGHVLGFEPNVKRTKVQGICFEKLYSASSPIQLLGFPANSKRAILAFQNGVIKLVSVPVPGRNKTMNAISTWLDLSSRVIFDAEKGLLGVAFHPKFLKNGRFFVSYICDSSKHPDCKGPCPCTKANGCNPQVNPKATCRFNTIVSEYWAGHKPSTAKKVKVKEVRRILNFARPFQNHNGGYIFFGKDGYLYYTSGDGGNGGDPWNFAQKGTTFFGKILRLDINARTKTTNYSIPKSNPFVNQKGVRKEIFALGLRNPWRCSVDQTTSAIFCGDVGQNKVEEVDRILPGRNYGWKVFEGREKYQSSGPAPNTPVSKMIGKLTFPILEYTHNSLPYKFGAVIGGIVYRANRNRCFQGKFLYNDYTGPMWIADVYSKKPVASSLKIICSRKSPLKCPQSSGISSLGLSYFSWALDSAKDAYVLTDSGVFRVTNSEKCGLKC